MAKASHEFQVFAKPIGSACNLHCHYCYYREKGHLCQTGEAHRMSEDLLEEYLVQHIEACSTATIRFSWHGGEPTLLGLDYFRTIVNLQRRHQPPGRLIVNGMQTNGTLLDEDWCRFLKAEGFSVGLSLDGPKEMHDCYRVARNQEPTHEQVMRAYALLLQYRIPRDILCVVHAQNVSYPDQVYRFFREIGAQYIGFLPLVERLSGIDGGVSARSAPAGAFGAFLCAIFDEWQRRDIGRVKIQIFEEMAETALGMGQALCIFQKTCGNIPVVEHNGDFFSCDHFVDDRHRLGNIQESPLVDLLESPAQRAFGEEKLKSLPRCCRACEVLALCNGGCPKDRFINTPEGEGGLNYLCAGYKRFFTHARPFVAELSALWQGQSLDRNMTPARAAGTEEKTGRNDPCPCGSGRKYKKCCLGR